MCEQTLRTWSPWAFAFFRFLWTLVLECPVQWMEWGVKDEITDEHSGELRLKSRYCAKEPGKEGTRGKFFEKCNISVDHKF